MPTPVSRRTVDLSAYPDLVVVYLGMRVNRITGIKTLLGFGPGISDSVAAQPDACSARKLFFSFFPMHVALTGATWSHSSHGPAPSRTAFGGRDSCATPGAPAFGTRPTRCAAAWKPSTTTSPEDRLHELRSHRPRARIHVHCLPALRPRQRTRASDHRIRTLRKVTAVCQDSLRSAVTRESLQSPSPWLRRRRCRARRCRGGDGISQARRAA